MANWAAIGALGTAAEGAGNYFGLVNAEQKKAAQLKAARENKIEDRDNDRAYQKGLTKDRTDAAIVVRDEKRQYAKDHIGDAGAQALTDHQNKQQSDYDFDQSNPTPQGASYEGSDGKRYQQMTDGSTLELPNGIAGKGGHDEMVGTSTHMGPHPTDPSLPNVRYATYTDRVTGQTYDAPLMVRDDNAGSPAPAPAGAPVGRPEGLTGTVVTPIAGLAGDPAAASTEPTSPMGQIANGEPVSTPAAPLSNAPELPNPAATPAPVAAAPIAPVADAVVAEEPEAPAAVDTSAAYNTPVAPADAPESPASQEQYSSMSDAERQKADILGGYKANQAPAGGPRYAMEAKKPPTLFEIERRADAIKLIYSVGNMKRMMAPNLETGEAGYDPSSIEGFKDQYTYGGLTNFLASGKGQEFQREAMDASETLLRLATGAAAPEPEVVRYRGMYVPEGFDGPNVVKAKMAALDNMVGVLGGLKDALANDDISVEQYNNAVEGAFEADKAEFQRLNGNTHPVAQGNRPVNKGQPLTREQRLAQLKK